jgi:transposase
VITFKLRRDQIILTSARGEYAIAIAHNIDRSDEAVREAIKAFNLRGLQALKPGSRRSHKIQAAHGGKEIERLKETLHQSPRNFGESSSVLTCDLAAEVSFDRQLTHEQVSGDTIRATLQQLGAKWSRAKH